MAYQSQLLKQMKLTAQDVDWEAIYREEMPSIYNYFRYRLGDGPQAEDLTAITFEKAWRGRAQYRWKRASFSTWLFTIARNVATDYFRQQRHELSLEQVPAVATGPSIDEALGQQEELAYLAELLQQLPDRERELIALKYGAELKNRRIAAITGLSATNVAVILHRTVRKLRQAWEQRQGEQNR